MKVVIKQNSPKIFTVTICYLLTIGIAFFSSNIMKYLMYAVIIGTAFLMEVFTRKANRIQNNCRYILAITGMIVVVTLFAGLIAGKVNAGSIIQPIFLYSSFALGYYVAIKYQEDGCRTMLKQLSYILLFAAVVCIPEYLMQKSIFFKTYGNTWDAFRVPSIYGHPIRLGTSLTIALAIDIFIYKKSFIKYCGILLSLFGIFVSASRSSWLACAGVVALTVFAVYRKRLTDKKVLFGIFGAVLLFVFLLSPMGQSIINAIGSRFQEATADNVSRVQRLGAISYFWEDFVDNFNLITPVTLMLGHGEDAAANFMLNTSIVFNNFSTTDNEYLLVIYNYGLIVLIFVLIGIYKCIKKYITNYEKNNPVENCLCFICISQAICSFFYEITENKSCAFLLMCSIGMLIGLNSHKKRRKLSKNNYIQNK